MIPTLTDAYRKSLSYTVEGAAYIPLLGACVEPERFYLKSQQSLTALQAEIARDEAILAGTIGADEYGAGTKAIEVARRIALNRLADAELDTAIATARTALQTAVTAAETYQAAHPNDVPAELVPTMPD